MSHDETLSCMAKSVMNWRKSGCTFFKSMYSDLAEGFEETARSTVQKISAAAN